MDLKLFSTVFLTIFVAELGDKTQLATMLYAAEASHPKLTVFAASAAALVLTSALGVLAGSVVAQYVSPKVIRWVAGFGFIAVDGEPKDLFVHRSVVGRSGLGELAPGQTVLVRIVEGRKGREVGAIRAE